MWKDHFTAISRLLYSSVYVLGLFWVGRVIFMSTHMRYFLMYMPMLSRVYQPLIRRMCRETGTCLLFSKPQKEIACNHLLGQEKPRSFSHVPAMRVIFHGPEGPIDTNVAVTFGTMDIYYSRHSCHHSSGRHGAKLVPSFNTITTGTKQVYKRFILQFLAFDSCVTNYVPVVTHQ